MGEVLNLYWSEHVAAVIDAGIDFVDSLTEAIHNAEKDDKLVLVYFHDSNANDNLFINILKNNDINSLFKNDFCVFVSDATDAYRQREFKLLLGDKTITEFTNNLFVVKKVLNNNMALETIINTVDTSQADIVYELYMIHEKFQEELMNKNDRIVEVCAKLYLNDFHWLDSSLEFNYISLKQALDISVNQPLKHLRKILILYMYKETSKLSKLFFDYVNNGHLQKYNRLFMPIFWNISDPKYHKQLQIACGRYFEEAILEETVTSAEGGIFFFVPIPLEGMMKSVPKIFTAITDSNHYNPQSLSDTLDYLFDDFQCSNQITDLYELKAINGFANRIDRSCMHKYVDRNTLHDITEMCLQVPRKMFLLYFGVQSSKLWRTLSNLNNVFIEDKIVLLPWDISNPAVRINLKYALQRTFGIKKMEMMLNGNRNALFIFVPIGKTLILYSVLQEDASESEITKRYKEAHQFFMLESELAAHSSKCEDNGGPIAYQQVMCDQMGDRDFDCFQLDKQEGTQLEEKIAFAYYGPPTSETEPYNSKQLKQIKKAFEKIKDVASKYGENSQMLYIGFMRVCFTPLPADKFEKLSKTDDYEPYLDFNVVPLFAIRKCFDCPEDNLPCRVYVDHTLRVYDNWEDFLENNRYPKVMLIAPKNGKYTVDYRGSVQLEICPTPACGIGPAILKGVDIGASILGGVAGVVGIVTATVIAAPVVAIAAVGTGVGVGIYSIVRSSMTIADRVKYGESMSIAESEARGAYLNILAGSLGFTTAGASFALGYMAKTGVNIGMTARAAMNGITIVNLTASGAAIGNSAYDVFTQWSDDGTVSTLTIIQLSSSVLFFGHAVYNVQTAGTIIRNAQSTSITEILDSLSSNRQRKTVIRLLNTTADKVGSVQGGNAEVISYMRNLDNIKEVVQVLTRDTKLMSKNGVKYSVDNGKVVFNGFEMNVNEFGNLSKIQRNEVLSAIPEASTSTRVSSATIKSSMSNLITFENAMTAINLAGPVVNILTNPELGFSQKIQNLVQRFSPFIQRELIIITGKLLKKIGIPTNNLFKSLQSLYPDAQVFVQILDMIIQYFKAEGIEKFVPDNFKKGASYAVNIIEKAIILSCCSMASLITQLIRYCSKWICQEIIQRSTDPAITASDSPRKRMVKKCDKCFGKFYK